MASTCLSLRAASFFCFVAAAQAFAPRQLKYRRDKSFTRDGCFVDNAGGQRALTGPSYADDSMKVASCAEFCSKYHFFGVEYGRECYCGNSNAAARADDSDCNFRCAGASCETCGAGDRLDIFTNLLYVAPEPATLDVPYLGCFVDEGARALPDNLLGADNMTAEVCQQHCAGYSYFGVEFGRECWCGNSYPSQDMAPASDCSFTCAGNDAEICGAGNRINVWGSPLPSTSPSDAVPSSTGVPTTLDTLPSSTIFSVPSSTEIPSPTTITSCSAAPTYIGVPETCWASVPDPCSTLSVLGAPLSCYSAFVANTAVSPAALSCFTALAGPAFTATSMYSCIQNAPSMYCQYTTPPCGATATGGASPAPTNAVTDGGFESGGVASWTPVGSTVDDSIMQVSVSGDLPHTGAKSLKVVYNNANGRSRIYMKQISLQPGATHLISWWWYSTNSASSSWSQMQLTGGGVSFIFQANTLGGPTNQWVQATKIFTAQTSFATIWFSVIANMGAAGNTFYVDDISITQVVD